VHKWAIYERDPLPTWRAGKIVLLGDVWHPMTPCMAQGAATAVEDAAVLARCLAEAGQECVEDAFRRYEEHRKPRATQIQLESRQNRWLRHATDPGWVYRYDAWSVPLENTPEATTSRSISA
jgi:2-polyprenyl-6-methoxyphenol hydroxylase and related FAD-dependent oxidoreductases